MKTMVLLMVIRLSFLNTFSQQTIETIDSVDMNRYGGRWFVIASCSEKFQNNCHCSTIDYESVPNKPYIKIINRCIKINHVKSNLIKSRAIAFPLKGSKNSKFKVQYVWPFRDDYYIIDLANDYSWAVIGHPKRKSLLILSRESVLPSFIYKNILNTIQERGYDGRCLVKTPQNCDPAK